MAHKGRLALIAGHLVGVSALSFGQLIICYVVGMLMERVTGMFIVNMLHL